MKIDRHGFFWLVGSYYYIIRQTSYVTYHIKWTIAETLEYMTSDLTITTTIYGFYRVPMKS